MHATVGSRHPDAQLAASQQRGKCKKRASRCVLLLRQCWCCGRLWTSEVPRRGRRLAGDARGLEASLGRGTQGRLAEWCLDSEVARPHPPQRSPCSMLRWATGALQVLPGQRRPLFQAPTPRMDTVQAVQAVQWQAAPVVQCSSAPELLLMLIHCRCAKSLLIPNPNVHSGDPRRVLLPASQCSSKHLVAKLSQPRTTHSIEL